VVRCGAWWWSDGSVGVVWCVVVRCGAGSGQVSFLLGVEKQQVSLLLLIKTTGIILHIARRLIKTTGIIFGGGGSTKKRAGIRFFSVVVKKKGQVSGFLAWLKNFKKTVVYFL
jgi:hypothetical protein